MTTTDNSGRKLGTQELPLEPSELLAGGWWQRGRARRGVVRGDSAVLAWIDRMRAVG
mgnify:CR=1 FL=1